MGRCRVVEPHVTRLALSDGDWVDVKRDLNAGDYMDYLRGFAARQAFAKILAYVLAWSFVGLDGQPIPYTVEMPEEDRRNTVRSLDLATAKELIAVVDRHELAQDAALAAKKKSPDSSSTSNLPSGSVSG